MRAQATCGPALSACARGVWSCTASLTWHMIHLPALAFRHLKAVEVECKATPKKDSPELCKPRSLNGLASVERVYYLEMLGLIILTLTKQMSSVRHSTQHQACMQCMLS